MVIKWLKEGQRNVMVVKWLKEGQRNLGAVISTIN